MTATKATDLTAMALALASATKPCPNCRGVGHYKEADDDFYDCSLCEGTGEVYVLDSSLRVECHREGEVYFLKDGSRHVITFPDCPDCGGRNWYPLDPRFGWEWMMALEKRNLIDLDSDPVNGWRCKFQTRQSDSRVTVDTPGLAFFLAATKALNLPTETDG